MVPPPARCTPGLPGGCATRRLRSSTLCDPVQSHGNRVRRVPRRPRSRENSPQTGDGRPLLAKLYQKFDGVRRPFASGNLSGSVRVVPVRENRPFSPTGVAEAFVRRYVRTTRLRLHRQPLGDGVVRGRYPGRGVGPPTLRVGFPQVRHSRRSVVRSLSGSKKQQFVEGRVVASLVRLERWSLSLRGNSLVRTLGESFSTGSPQRVSLSDLTSRDES
jgi:hypothetical protein